VKRACGVCGQDQSKRWFRPPRSPDLTSWWIERYTGQSFGDSLSRLLARFHFDSKTARISLGDILAVIAEKR